MKFWLKKNQNTISIAIITLCVLGSCFLYWYEKKLDFEHNEYNKAFLASPLQEGQMSLAKARELGMITKGESKGIFMTATRKMLVLVKDGQVFVRSAGENDWRKTPLKIEEQVVSLDSCQKGQLLVDGKQIELWSVYIATDSNIYAFMVNSPVTDSNVMVLPMNLPE